MLGHEHLAGGNGPLAVFGQRIQPFVFSQETEPRPDAEESVRDHLARSSLEKQMFGHVSSIRPARFAFFAGAPQNRLEFLPPAGPGDKSDHPPTLYDDPPFQNHVLVHRSALLNGRSHRSLFAKSRSAPALARFIALRSPMTTR